MTVNPPGMHQTEGENYRKSETTATGKEMWFIETSMKLH